MTESIIDIRDRLKSRRPTVVRRSVTQTDVLTDPPEVPAFAIENPDTNRLTVSTPLTAETAHAITADDFTLQLSGRLVEAERANRNGAFWTQGDLEFGLPSVAYGPLNWLHEESKIIGTLLNPKLVDEREAAATDPGVGPHIRTDAVVWGWLHPREMAAVKEYAGAGQAWLSMECISQEIACVGPNGCGTKASYLDYQRKSEKACTHLRERSSHRRFVNPIFQGAAVIVPPTQPGWGRADLGLKVTATTERQAASLLEDHTVDVPGMEAEAAHSILSQIIQWSAR